MFDDLFVEIPDETREQRDEFADFVGSIADEVHA
jgi:hypothetical protein